MELRWRYHGYRPLLAKQLLFRVSEKQLSPDLNALILDECRMRPVIFIPDFTAAILAPKRG